MITALYRPLRGESILWVAAGLVAANAAYCIAYNTLAGQRETLGQALLWGLINILPWYLAFEAAKRSASAIAVATALAAAGVTSMLLDVLAYGASDLGFELIRRIPALVLVLGLLASGRLLASARSAREHNGKGRLPLSPGEVDWVSAAGNYVELRAQGRTVLHRAPLSHVQAELERHGFVRIHRSILVRRERIARVRPHDVVLQDGTCLKTGSRYRSSLH
jgi:hypothetical protein